MHLTISSWEFLRYLINKKNKNDIDIRSQLFLIFIRTTQVNFFLFNKF